MDIGVFIGPLAAGLAVVVTLYPPKSPRAVHGWALLFAALGVISVVQEMRRSDHEAQRDRDFSYLQGKMDQIAENQATAAREETKRTKIIAGIVSPATIQSAKQDADRARAALANPAPPVLLGVDQIPEPTPTARYLALRARALDLRSRIFALIEKYLDDAHGPWGTKDRDVDFSKLKDEYLASYRQEALTMFAALSDAMPEQRCTINYTLEEDILPIPHEPMNIVDVAEWLNSFAGQLDGEARFGDAHGPGPIPSPEHTPCPAFTVQQAVVGDQ